MTPFKTILIHAGKEQRFQNQLAVGVDIAARFRSHLVGLAVLPPPIEIPTGMPGAPSTITVDAHRTAFRDEARRMQSDLQSAAARQAISSEWLLEDGAAAEGSAVLVDHAQTADLVISGPLEAGLKGLRGASVAERLILGSGRPVLVVPRGQTAPAAIGNRVLVAWNGTRESTRAAFDALPLLKTAHHVKVLAIGEEHRSRGRATRPPEQLCQILARHDVRARPEVISLPGADVGSALLSSVKAENADLLVMGCYGHPRLYEYALGGTTRHVLYDASVPVLTSH